MLTKKIVSILALSSVLLATAPAQAGGGFDGGSNMSIRMHAYVPVICRVKLSTSISPSADEGVVNLGTANEFCNAPRGYRIVVSHTPDLVGAAVISGGERIPLSSSGETLLRQSSHADFRTTQLALDLGEEPSAFRTIGMRIEPLVCGSSQLEGASVSVWVAA